MRETHELTAGINIAMPSAVSLGFALPPAWLRVCAIVAAL
jgi:hypothetical protein